MAWIERFVRSVRDRSAICFVGLFQRRRKAAKCRTPRRWRFCEPLEERRLLSITAPWTGAVDNNLNNAANYVGGVAPGNGDSVDFATAAQPNVVNNSSGLSLGSINFDANVSLGGAPIGLGGQIVAAAGASGTIAANIATGVVDKTGPGTATLTGTNSFAGGTAVEQGTLIVATPATLPNGSDVTVGDAMAFVEGPPAPTAHFFRALPRFQSCDQSMDVSSAGVVYATGMATVSANDFGNALIAPSTGGGLTPGQRVYGSMLLASSGGIGPGWTLADQPYMVHYAGTSPHFSRPAIGRRVFGGIASALG